VKIPIIIVHKNERSLDLSIKSAQCQAEKVLLVSEPSFNMSMRKAFKIAIEEGWDYMILMGGDQILLKGAIKKLSDHVGNKFRVSGWGYDKLLMRKRMMAPSLYRVDMLGQALEINTEGQIQPESYILHKMGKHKIIDDMLAMHDYRQYYTDIYRKGQTEAGKILQYILKNDIISDLKKSKDPDHKVFLQGIIDYINHKTRLDILQYLKLKEKI
jgi:hypothetical protein